MDGCSRAQRFPLRGHGWWGGGCSIGCDAVFLLGGPSKEDAPTPMRLRSGDCVLMAGEARQCHHGDCPFAKMLLEKEDVTFVFNLFA